MTDGSPAHDAHSCMAAAAKLLPQQSSCSCSACSLAVHRQLGDAVLQLQAHRGRT